MGNEKSFQKDQSLRVSFLVWENNWFTNNPLTFVWLFDSVILFGEVSRRMRENYNRYRPSFGHHSKYLHQIAFLISLFACHSFVPTLFRNLMKNSFFLWNILVSLIYWLPCVLSKFVIWTFSANGNLLEGKSFRGKSYQL